MSGCTGWVRWVGGGNLAFEEGQAGLQCRFPRRQVREGQWHEEGGMNHCLRALLQGHCLNRNEWLEERGKLCCDFRNGCGELRPCPQRQTYPELWCPNWPVQSADIMAVSQHARGGGGGPLLDGRWALLMMRSTSEQIWHLLQLTAYPLLHTAAEAWSHLFLKWWEVCNFVSPFSYAEECVWKWCLINHNQT